ncbi:hypothetical protein O0L34_g8963 [Tuta absoluta]|nr:hypothetical protein O0L34_g8963 [Tuta absoluta]
MSGNPQHRYKIRRVVRAVGCREDHQCPTGFYCEESRLSCRQCQSCNDLNRQPRVNETTCVRTVTACGACLTGLVPSPSDNKCLSPSNQQLLLPYEWAVIAVGLLLAVVVCALAVYVLRHFDSFKLYTRTSVLTPVDVEARAPQSPPPPAYNDIAALPPSHPDPLHHEQERAPFIKPISPRARVALESAKRQVATVFTPPRYAQILSDDVDLPNIRETLPAIQETTSDIISNEDPINSTNAIPPDMEEANETGRQEMQNSSAKILQNMQDGNNNSEASDDGSEDTRRRHSLGGTAFVINVFSNNASAQQGNQLNV